MSPTDPLTDRLPPHNKEAERAVLGGILRDPETLPDAQEILRTESFYFDAHRAVYSALLALAAENQPPDLVLVHDRLKRGQQLADVGGHQALADLWESVPTGANVEYHARIVRDLAIVRALIHASNETLRDSYDRTGTAEDLLAQAERRVLGIADADGELGELVDAAGMAREAMEAIDARRERDGPDGLLTGFPGLDAVLSGMRPGQMIVVGARPGCGKTALAVAVATHNTASKIPVLFASAEMPRSEIADRILAMRSGVPLRAIQRGRLSAEQSEAFSAAGLAFSAEPFSILDKPELTAARLGSVVRRGVRRRGVRLVVVDYLQLLRAENPRDPRHLQVGTLARRVKELARACQVPALLLCQLSREVEHRADGRPRLSDLRESGEIEAHADAVLLLHPQPDQAEDAAVWRIDVMVAKNRNGPTATVTLAYRRGLTRFESAAKW